MSEEYIPLPRAAERLGVSYHSLIMKIRKRKINDHVIGRNRFLSNEEFERLQNIERLKQMQKLLEV